MRGLGRGRTAGDFRRPRRDAWRTYGRAARVLGFGAGTRAVKGVRLGGFPLLARTGDRRPRLLASAEQAGQAATGKAEEAWRVVEGKKKGAQCWG